MDPQGILLETMSWIVGRLPSCYLSCCTTVLYMSPHHMSQKLSRSSWSKHHMDKYKLVSVLGFEQLGLNPNILLPSLKNKIGCMF